MSNKTKITIAIVALIASFGAGRFSKPAKVEVQTKEVVKTVTVQQEAKVITVYKDKVTKPDGTIVETEKSVTDSNTTSTTASVDKNKTDSKTTNDSGLTLQALAIVNTGDITGKRDYGLYVKKRVLGNLSVGAIVTTGKQVGIGVGLDF